ncbi:MAG: ExeA family protein [bacterium]|jgi:general secretion pathway protein A
MFEEFFSFTHTPFTRDVPVEELFRHVAMEELHERLLYVARHRLFAVVTGDVGCGKTTTLRMLSKTLDQGDYKLMYISDSALTPRYFYWGLLSQLGCEPRFYPNAAKKQLHRELEILREVHKKTPVVIVDEAHLLSREMLEEIRFLLNFNMDSYNPCALVLSGQNELRDTLKKQVFEAISQRINIRYILPSFERAQSGEYIARHLEYAGAQSEIFSEKAVDEIHRFAAGRARKINSACTQSLMHAAQIGKHIIDDHMVRDVLDGEIDW